MTATLPHRVALAFNAASEERTAVPGFTGGEALRRERTKLRRRSGHEFRNDPLINKALAELRMGLNANPWPTSDDPEATAAFKAWGASCGYRHQHGAWPSLARTTAQHYLEDGEVFVQKVWSGARWHRNGLLLAVWPARLIDTTRGHNWTGHEYEDGLWSGTWFQAPSVEPNHQRYERTFVPARDLIWLRFNLWADQVDGVPRAHASLESAQQLGDYAVTALDQQRAAACLSAIALAAPSILPTTLKLGPSIRDADGNEFTDLEPGSLPIAHNIRDIKVVNPTTGNQFSVTQHAGRVAAGAGLTGPLVTGDMAQVSFSQARYMLESRRATVQELADPYDLVRERIVQWVIEAELLRGRDYRGANYRWTHRPVPAMNPQQQSRADEIDLKTGIKSLAQVISERGLDPAKIMAEVESEREITNSNTSAAAA